MESDNFNFIELRPGPKGGLTLPLAAVELALDLERRDLKLSIEGDRLRVSGPNGKPDLSPADVDAIRKYKAHLMALVAYEPPDPK